MQRSISWPPGVPRRRKTDVERTEDLLWQAVFKEASTREDSHSLNWSCPWQRGYVNYDKVVCNGLYEQGFRKGFEEGYLREFNRGFKRGYEEAGLDVNQLCQAMAEAGRVKEFLDAIGSHGTLDQLYVEFGIKTLS